VTTVSDMLFQLGGMPALAGVPFGPKAHYYFVDPVNGLDANNGTSADKPKKTLAAAEALTIGNQHDTVFFIAGADADTVTAEIAWDKSYTHLIGVGSQLPGLGQRCRVVSGGAAAVHDLITFSGDGCIVKNMQFNQEHATGTATGSVIVSGERNYFENVFAMMPTSQTAASYALKTVKGENTFVRCTIGQHTKVRSGSAASYSLWLSGGGGDSQRNKFINCEMLSWSNGAAHELVHVDADITEECWTVFFESCLFDNFKTGGASLTAAIVDASTAAYHQILFRGQNLVYGCTAVANPLTYTVAPDADDAVSGLLGIAVIEN